MYYISYRWFWINKIRFKLKLIDWLIFRKIRFNKNWKIEKIGQSLKNWCTKNVNNEIFMGWNGGKVEVTTFSTIEREYHRKGKRWSRGTPSILLVEVVGEERIVSTSFLSFLQVSSPLQLPMEWLVGDNYSIFFFLLLSPIFYPSFVYLTYEIFWFFVVQNTCNVVFLFNENLLLYNNDDFLIHYFESIWMNIEY